MKPIIKTEDEVVTYNEGKSNEFRALQGINIDIFPGEYIILFGPSGCGKSTLLYSILGVLPPSSGKVIVKGESIYDYNVEQMVKFQQKTVGIVYQSFNLIPSLSVADNVALPQVFASVDALQRRKRAMELLDRFGVAPIADKFTTNLSGGQMQRVAVARSLVNNPEILLGDEPVGNLDTVSAAQVMDTLEEINMNDQKTVILVTHDAKYLPYAHRVYYLNDGQILRDVPNPEKKQIKKSGNNAIVTEIELLAKKFPYNTVEELRVKSAVNYLTQDMNFREISILEKTVEAAINGKLGRDGFFDILHADIREGGVGLTKAQAQKITDQMMTILNQARDITRFRHALEDDKLFYYQHKYIKRVKAYILSSFQGHLSSAQEKALEEAVSQRLSGFLKGDGFEKKLYNSLEDNGVGLSIKTAMNVTTYLEKLIAQGVEYMKKGEEYIHQETKQT